MGTTGTATRSDNRAWIIGHFSYPHRACIVRGKLQETPPGCRSVVGKLHRFQGRKEIQDQLQRAVGIFNAVLNTDAGRGVITAAN